MQEEGAIGMAEDSSDLDLAPLTIALSKLTKDLARKIVQDRLPSLVEQAVRQTLPDLLKPIVEQLAQNIIEKVARELVPDHAEAAVKKEIERLTAEG